MNLFQLDNQDLDLSCIIYKQIFFSTFMANVDLISISNATKLLPTMIQSKASKIQNSTSASVTKQSPGNTKIIGNYILGKLLGKGTFGSVHLALHIPTNQKVAVKIIDKSTMLRKKDVIRTHKEIQIMKKIHHRHIVQLYEIIQTKNSLLLFQQHLPNGQLFKQILKKKKFSEEQACKYFQQIISALDYLHHNKIAHRDLKPENILIDFDGQLKLIDFGLSTQYEKDMTTFCGSPCYAAPQILEGKKGYNPQSADLWSCGVILFTMLAGYLPFCQTNVNVMFKKVMSGSYKMPDSLSASAKNLIESLLILNPSKRISIKQIKNHEWFNQIPNGKAFGINKNFYLPYCNEMIRNMQKMGIDTNYFKNCDKEIPQKTRQTASYYILMKKLIKAEELIPYYIGDDFFDYNLITKKQNYKEQEDFDTDSLSPQQINISDDPYSLKAVQTNSQMMEPGEDNVDYQEIDLRQTNLGYPVEEIKAISQQQLISIVNNIYYVAINPFFKVQNINKNNPLKEKIEIRLQKQFYKDNLNHKKVFLKKLPIIIQQNNNKSKKIEQIIQKSINSVNQIYLGKRFVSLSLNKDKKADKNQMNKNQIDKNIHMLHPYRTKLTFRIRIPSLKKRQSDKKQKIIRAQWQN